MTVRDVYKRQLKVVASDGKADSAAYTVTFAKKVTKATVTLAAPLAADDAISVMGARRR